MRSSRWSATTMVLLLGSGLLGCTERPVPEEVGSSNHRGAAPASRDLSGLVARLAAPGIRLVLVDKPSRSYFGGSPRLPVGVQWPEHNGVRLAFLARLSLAELHAAHPIEWLPAAGALLFFYDVENEPWGFDPKDRGRWAVLSVPDLPAPVPPVSGAAAESPSPLKPHSLSFLRMATLPSRQRDEVQALSLSDPEFDRYEEIRAEPFQGKAKHQIGGFPEIIQGDGMELEAQLASHGLYLGNEAGFNDPRASALKAGAADWRLLLQIDSDDDLGSMWGDSGILYFWVRQPEARSGNFGGSWVVLQCY